MCGRRDRGATTRARRRGREERRERPPHPATHRHPTATDTHIRPVGEGSVRVAKCTHPQNPKVPVLDLHFSLMRATTQHHNNAECSGGTEGRKQEARIRLLAWAQASCTCPIPFPSLILRGVIGRSPPSNPITHPPTTTMHASGGPHAPPLHQKLDTLRHVWCVCTASSIPIPSPILLIVLTHPHHYHHTPQGVRRRTRQRERERRDRKEEKSNATPVCPPIASPPPL